MYFWILIHLHPIFQQGRNNPVENLQRLGVPELLVVTKSHKVALSLFEDVPLQLCLNDTLGRILRDHNKNADYHAVFTLQLLLKSVDPSGCFPEKPFPGFQGSCHPVFNAKAKWGFHQECIENVR